MKTVAIENKGIDDLAAAIETYQTQRGGTAGLERRKAISRWRILELLREQLLTRALKRDGAAATLERMTDEVARRERDPYSAVNEIMKGLK